MAINLVTLQTKFSEWKDITNSIIASLGDTDTLSTTAKDSLVSAVNELLGQIGDITSLTTDSKGSLVESVNEVDANVGDLTAVSATLGSVTTVVSALNNIATIIGDRTTLTTTSSVLVGAINELDAALDTAINSIGDKSTLTTTNKTSVVDAINELDADIGDTSTLSTTNKTSVVDSINEVNSTKIEQRYVKIENQIENRGRFATETTKTVSTFDFTVSQLTPFNSAVVAAGDKFITDNATFGGSGGTLGTDATALMTAIQTAGRTNVTDGFEFFIADVTVGGGTADPETFNTQNYYPIFDGSDTFIGQIGSVATFECWINVATVNDEATFGGILLGDSAGRIETYIDGVKAAQQSILTTAAGWVHIRQVVTLETEYERFLPAIYANVNDVVKIALPVLVNQDVSNNIHLGVV